MRKRLKNINWHIYGLGISDFDYIIRVNRDFARHRREYMKHRDEIIRAQFPDTADDILDDELYYLGLETYYLWEYCIVRLIGIFEGAIEKHFLPSGTYYGYENRIKALKKQGYVYGQEETVGEWVKLRNAIAHSPPEAWKPHLIEESDTQECCELLKYVFQDLLNQKSEINEAIKKQC